jgi:pimeloyl-ACP methyl ester carboxylesterase
VQSEATSSRLWSLAIVGIVVSLVFVFLAAVPAAGTDHEAEHVHPSVPGLDWQPCGPDDPGVECATATVPLDYDEPHGATTELALARVRAADTKNRIGSVFVNPGGPGGSGVALVKDGFGAFLGGRLAGRFDVVGFDPRGVGTSNPIRCFDNQDDVDAFFGALPVFPYEEPQFRPFYDRYASIANQCLHDGNAVARHMSTADVARDLDLLREAVGDDALTYLGFSYGSYIGTTYTNLFPHNIRALVIDGVLDPRLFSSGWQIWADRIATQEVFDEFLRLCDEAANDCAFATAEGSAERWDDLVAALIAEPVDLGDGFLYSYDFLIADAVNLMYVPEFWGGEDGYAAFLDFVADIALGDRSAAAQAVGVRTSLLERLDANRTTEEAETDYDGPDAFFGNHCADAEYPSTFERYREIDRFALEGSPFGPYWWWFTAGCSQWPVAEDRYVGPWNTETSAPVLVVGNFFDPATDYAGAQASARLLADSRLLSYAGWGHTAYGRSACATQYTDAYLLDGSLPPVGLICPANPNPFTDAASALATRPPTVGLPGPWLLRSEPMP